MSEPAIQSDLWIAHDHPERPLAPGAWVCCCEPCALALHATAMRRPGRPIVFKRSQGRTILPVAEVVRLRWRDDWDALVADPDDWIREVFVGRGPDIRGTPRPVVIGAPPACGRCSRDDEG